MIKIVAYYNNKVSFAESTVLNHFRVLDTQNRRNVDEMNLHVWCFMYIKCFTVFLFRGGGG
jgi:hypothetical protein